MQQPLAEPTEECIVVLAGQIEIQLSGQTYELKTGDTIYFENRYMESIRALGTGCAEYISAVATAHLIIDLAYSDQPIPQIPAFQDRHNIGIVARAQSTGDGDGACCDVRCKDQVAHRIAPQCKERVIGLHGLPGEAIDCCSAEMPRTKRIRQRDFIDSAAAARLHK